MKRAGRVLLASLLLLCTVALCACELNVFGSAPAYVEYTEGVVENERYILWDGILVDKQEKKVYGLQYPTGDRLYYASLYRSRYSFDADAIRQYAYLQSAKYDVDTGEVTHYVYYRTEIVFDYYGAYIQHTSAEEPLSEEEFRAESGEHLSESTLFSFSQTEGSGRPSDPEADGVTYTEAQQKVVDYALSLEKTKVGEFHCTSGMGRVIGERIWFVVNRYNQKSWGQSPVTQGLYSSMVICYDPVNDTFEKMIELDDGEDILVFNETHVIVKDNETLYSISYETREPRKIMKLDDAAYCYFEASDSLLHVRRMASIRGNSPEGTMFFSLPCDLHWFITLEGEVICEDYDISREDKERVETAENLEIQ